MNNTEQINSQAGMEQPRLPRIDPVTFSALNALDGFIGRALLSRQEHAEANRCLQHLVQTIEMLQGAIEQRNSAPVSGAWTAGNGNSAQPAGGMGPAQSDVNGGRVVASVAEEVFGRRD